MKRFRFRLEKILELRKYTEREWELKLAEITGICLSLDQRIQACAQEKVRVFRARFSSESGTVVLNLHFLSDTELYIRKLDQDIKKLQEERAKREMECQEIHRKFMEASTKRKVLDKLKEKKSSEYYEEQMKEENNLIDEINNGSGTRRRVRERMEE